MASPSDIILGIDLGTTNSLVAIADQRGPRVLPDEQGRSLLPSVVRFTDSGEPVVGSDAKRDAPEYPLTTISSVKRLMGRSLADARTDLPFLPYRVVEGEHQTARVLVSQAGNDRLVSPQEVSAIVLARLREQAERALGLPAESLRRAVVTVPAYFDDAQRQATRDACRLAGLEAVRIVNEPTAAALAYGFGVDGTRAGDPGVSTIAVYDLGGGTFDVSVLRLTPSTSPDGTSFFQVLATSGDTHLGGDDIDHIIVAMIAQDLAASGHAAPTPGFKRRLIAEAERVKIALSDADVAEFRVQPDAGEQVSRRITRAELEAAVAPLVARTLDACARALRDAKLPAVDAVILVGGATRMPIVRRRVGEFFGREPFTAIDPDKAVALGAAMQASILSGASRGALLLDVIPLSLGIETVGGAVAKLIFRNSTVPVRAKEMFSTSVDGQTSIKLNVLQGEREMAPDCRSLGEFHLRGLPPMPAGVPQLEVEFLVDASGVLNVQAHERRSGKRASLQVIPNHGLTREEVDRIEAESFTHAREDMTRHRIVDLIVNSKLDLKWIGERLQRFGPELDPPYRAELESKIAALRASVEAAELDWHAVNADAFHHAKESLDRASVRLQEVGIAASLRDNPPAPR
jgi:molecular chaperone DnaK (HSP70)